MESLLSAEDALTLLRGLEVASAADLVPHARAQLAFLLTLPSGVTPSPSVVAVLAAHVRYLDHGLAVEAGEGPIYTAADVAAMIAEERAAAAKFVQGQRSTWEAGEFVAGGKHRVSTRGREPTASTPETSCARVPSASAVRCEVP